MAVYTPAKLFNDNILMYYKDVACLLFGSVCGILQLNSFNGIIFFVITNILSSLFFRLVVIRKNEVTDFFKYWDFFIGDIIRQMATFAMMWCLFGALVSY